MGKSRYIEQIARRRGCTSEEAHHFCLAVQRLRKVKLSHKIISIAVRELPPDASVEAVAQHTERFPSEPKGKGRAVSRLTQSSRPPKYIIVDGVVQRTESWQKSESVGPDE